MVQLSNADEFRSIQVERAGVTFVGSETRAEVREPDLLIEG
jgi:hypothetical protein